MFCRHCGNELAENTNFCSACGNPVTPLAAQETVNTGISAPADDLLDETMEVNEAVQEEIKAEEVPAEETVLEKQEEPMEEKVEETDEQPVWQPTVQETVQQQIPVQEPVFEMPVKEEIPSISMQDTVIYKPPYNPEVPAEETKKQKKGLSAVGVILLPAIVLLIASMLLSWNTAIFKYYPAELEDVEYEARRQTVFTMYESTDEEIEWVEEQLEVEWVKADEKFYKHYENFTEGLAIVKLLSMVASIAILAAGALLFISVILLAKEIKAAKIFSILGGIIMVITSGVYAAAMPLITNLYGKMIILEGIWGVYVTLGLSLVITIVSIFYRKKKKIK